jgi:hypothetical protein
MMGKNLILFLQLLPTFVFAQWWLFKAATVRVGKR